MVIEVRLKSALHTLNKIIKAIECNKEQNESSSYDADNENHQGERETRQSDTVLVTLHYVTQDWMIS